MKKIFLILAFVCFENNILSAQKRLSETEKIAVAGKIYGFLKYYHPEVGQGKYDWDIEFINHLPKIIKANEIDSSSQIYNTWINSLGKIENCKKCKSEASYFDKNFDLTWTQDSTFFDKELRVKLKHIEENRLLEKNYYASLNSVGNIKITNEPSYSNFDYPTEDYRLLGLFKYWNIIEYFYPYKYLTDQTWDSVLLEMIPKFRTASNKEEYQSVIKELVAKLDDTHAWISFDNEKLKFLPVKISNIQNKPVISGHYNDSLANLNNLKLGDIILKVDGKEIKLEAEKQQKYVAGSNANIKTIKSYKEILRGRDSTIILTIKRNNQIKLIEEKRYYFKDFNYWNNHNSIKSKSINDKIGYINMASVTKKDIADIFKNFAKKKAILIDLRNYPNLSYLEVSKSINSDKRNFSKIYIPNISYPGKFLYQELVQTGTKNKKAFQGKIILLVNNETLSYSEFFTMALQTGDNVTTIGSQTAGADGDVTIFEYLGGFRTAISGTGVLYPDGNETQRKGIKIDINVEQTINGLSKGRDEILEKAIEIVSE